MIIIIFMVYLLVIKYIPMSNDTLVLFTGICLLAVVIDCKENYVHIRKKE